MLKRLLLGLVLGLLVGGLLGVGIAQVIPGAMTGVFGYAFAAVAGVLVGLVAGKPIWAKGAQIEAGLKSFFGALLGAGILFGLRYVPFTLPALAGFPAAELGRHAVASLAAVATILAIFYELDNTGEPEEEKPKARVASGGSDKARLASSGSAGGDDLDAEEEKPKAKQRK